MALTLRRNVSWNIVGRGVYAASQWLMLLVLARLGGPDAVGRFAFALAVTAPIVLFCNLSLRHIQATDAERLYDYDDYASVRLSTNLVAMLVILGVVVIAGHPRETALVIALVGLAKAFESMSDIVYGLEQVHRRLDLTARSMILRGFIGVAVAAAAYRLTGSLVGAVAAMTVAWAAVYLLLDRASERALRGDQQATSVARVAPTASSSWTRRLRLVRLSLPMGVVALLISLNANIPRYFIEAWLGEAALGAFTAMIYFVVVGSFVIDGIGQSALVDLSAAHAAGARRKFYRLLGRMIAISLALGLAGVIASALLGHEILVALYGPAFADDAGVFVWIMAAGALSYTASALFYGLTAQRFFTRQAVLYSVVATVQAGACALLIGRYALLGAAWAWAASLAVQLLLCALLVAPRRRGVTSATVSPVTERTGP